MPVTVSSTMQTRAAVAANDTTFLVVWFDRTEQGFSDDPDDVDLYAARVDPTTNTVLASDAAGVFLSKEVLDLAILSGEPDQSQPVVASNGSDFLVVFQSFGSVISLRVHGDTAHAFSEDGAGTPLGSTAYPVSVGYAGSTYVVGWSDASEVRSVRVDPATGLTPDYGGLPLLPGETQPIQEELRLACEPDACLFTWFDYQTAYHGAHFARWDPATGKPVPGDVASPPMLTLPADSVPFSVASMGGGMYAMATAPNRFANSHPGSVTLRLFDATTHTFSATTKTATDPDPNNMYALTYDGTRLLAGWRDSGGTNAFLETINPKTLALGGTGVLTLGNLDATLQSFQFTSLGGATLAVGSQTGTDVLVSGTTFSQTVDRVVSARLVDASRTIAPALAPGSFGTPVTAVQNGEVLPAIASSKSGALVAWIDTRDVQTVVYGARVDSNGVVDPADAAGLVLSPHPVIEIFTGPSVASDGTDYLVTWADSPSPNVRQIDGTKVSAATGTTKTMLTPMTNASGLLNPAVTFDGTSYVVVGTTFGTLVVQRFDPSALTPVGDPIVFTPTFPNDGLMLRPTIAVGASTYLVVAEVVPDGNDVLPYLLASRIPMSGAVDALDAKGFVVSSSATAQAGPSAAFAHGSFLVAWADLRESGHALSIYGRLVPPSGALPTTPDLEIDGVDGASFTSASLETQHPAVVDAKDGLNFQVAWSGTSGVFGALVSDDGVVRPVAALDISALPGDCQAPSLATVAPGKMLVTYARLDPSAGNYRVRVRTLETGATSGACSANTDCATRNCSDGFCCDQPCTGSCQTCAATPGKCTTVVLQADPDTCQGTEVCSKTGACEEVIGQPCVAASDCASGSCADGVCCDSACNGGCDVCNASAKTAGTCTVVAAASSGASPVCLPYLCDGQSHDCPSACTSDDECARPDQCIRGTCQIVAGASCSDAHTLALSNGTSQDCAPYACQSSVCFTTCSSILDCAPGFECDAAGKCVAATNVDLASGCSVRGDASSPCWSTLAAVSAMACRRRRRRTKTASTTTEETRS